MLKSGMPSRLSSMPFGPSESVSAMLLVKGGEMSGSTVTAAMNQRTGAGILMRTTAKAKQKPSAVPVTATAIASQMLFISASLS